MPPPYPGSAFSLRQVLIVLYLIGLDCVSFVCDMASESALCFCVRRSVFPGSSFKSLFMSRRFDWVVLIWESTPFRASCSLVVSTPISTVRPFILFAKMPHLPKKSVKKTSAVADAFVKNDMIILILIRKECVYSVYTITCNSLPGL